MRWGKGHKGQLSSGSFPKPGRRTSRRRKGPSFAGVGAGAPFRCGAGSESGDDEEHITSAHRNPPQNRSVATDREAPVECGLDVWLLGRTMSSGIPNMALGLVMCCVGDFTAATF